MCFKLQTNVSIYNSLKGLLKAETGSDVCDWATDLVLALLLQGATLRTLLKADTETCYHVALRLCCSTGVYVWMVICAVLGGCLCNEYT